jgi:hypothetical protein
MKLNDILKKRDHLTSEIDKLSKELDKKRETLTGDILAGKDPAKLVSEIRDLEGCIEAMQAAEKSAAVTVGEMTKGQTITDKAARVAELRKQEEALYPSVVNALVELAAKMDDLTEVHHQIMLAGGFPKLKMSNLTRQVQAELKRLQFASPELLGLPPKPTRREIAYHEAESELERLKAILPEHKKAQMYDSKIGKSLAEATQAAIRAAEQRLAELA